MLVLTGLTTPYPRKILYDYLSQITIKDTSDADVTESLYNAEILIASTDDPPDEPDDPDTGTDYLVRVFGEDWAFPASVALDIPLNSTDRLLL